MVFAFVPKRQQVSALILAPLQGDSLFERCSTGVKARGLSPPAPLGRKAPTPPCSKKLTNEPGFRGRFEHIALGIRSKNSLNKYVPEGQELRTASGRWSS